MTSKTKLSVPKGDVEIPTVSPSLMPFHITYSGPAPISTFFLTKPFVDANEKRRLASGIAEQSQEAEANDQDQATEPVKDIASTSNELRSASIGVGAGVQAPETSNRQQAAFRGRRIVSHAVQMPEGYTGLLLTQRGGAPTKASSPEGDVGGGADKKGKATAKAAVLKAGDRAKALKAKAAVKLKAGGAGRWSPRKAAREVEEEEELEPEDQPVQLEHEEVESGPVEPLVEEKVFEVAGKFQALTLWNPDVAVDETRDEYIRSVNEWVTLASEIHRI